MPNVRYRQFRWKGSVRPAERSQALRRLVVCTLLIAEALAWTQSAHAASSTPAAIAVARPDGTAALSWSFPPDAQRTRFEIATSDTTAGDELGWGTRYVDGLSTATVIDGLLPGRTYRFTVVSWGSSVTSATASVRLPSGACAWGSCAVVDANVSSWPAQRVAQGFLHTLTAQTPAAMLSPLRTTSWRIAPGDADRYEAVRAAGGTVTMVLSDAWLRDNWDGTRPRTNPWQDWDSYNAFVQQTVSWQKAHDMLPDYWDIQNEPDAEEQYAATNPPTRALVLEQLEVAYVAIKQTLPDAKIVGPSLAQAAADSTKLVDFNSVFADAVAHGLRYDAISWHENGYGDAGTFEGGSRAIAEHVAWVRKALSDHPALGSPPLFVNEYGARFAQGNPAAEIGYINALERAGVAAATHSCFPSLHLTVDTCSDPRGLLDGLLTTADQPTSAWWVHADYGEMAGARLFADGNTPQIVTYASRSTAGEIDVLVGNDLGCNPAIDSTYCPADTPVTHPITPRLTVTAPLGGPSRYSASIERMPYQLGALREPQSVLSGAAVNVSAGALILTLPTLAVGDAVIVRLVPMGAAGALPLLSLVGDLTS